jgi:hypothetical protein
MPVVACKCNLTEMHNRVHTCTSYVKRCIAEVFQQGVVATLCQRCRQFSMLLHERLGLHDLSLYVACMNRLVKHASSKAKE